MNKKYELTSETKVVFGKTLYRIRALKAFGDVEAGELGGWIEKEGNLAQEGECWVFGNGRVFSNGRVFGNGQVYDNGWVFGNGQVYGNGWVSGNGRVYDNGWVFGNARVCGDMVVRKTRDYLTFGPAGEWDDTTTFGTNHNGTVLVRCGRFYGTLDEFAEKVEEKHGNDEFGEEYRFAIEAAKVRFLREEVK